MYIAIIGDTYNEFIIAYEDIIRAANSMKKEIEMINGHKVIFVRSEIQIRGIRYSYYSGGYIRNKSKAEHYDRLIKLIREGNPDIEYINLTKYIEDNFNSYHTVGTS